GAARPAPAAAAAPTRGAPPPCPRRPPRAGPPQALRRARAASGAAARSRTEPGRTGRRSPPARRGPPREVEGSPTPEGDGPATPTRPRAAFHPRRTRGDIRPPRPVACARPGTTEALRRRRRCP